MTKKEFIYEAPEVSVVELNSEGVLCMSDIDGQTLTVDEWENGTFSW